MRSRRPCKPPPPAAPASTMSDNTTDGWTATIRATPSLAHNGSTEHLTRALRDLRADVQRYEHTRSRAHVEKERKKEQSRLARKEKRVQDACDMFARLEAEDAGRGRRWPAGLAAGETPYDDTTITNEIARVKACCCGERCPSKKTSGGSGASAREVNAAQSSIASPYYPAACVPADDAANTRARIAALETAFAAQQRK